MTQGLPLHDHLERLAGAGGPIGPAEREVVETIARVAIAVAELVSLGNLEGCPGAVCGSSAGGDEQKALDVEADRLFRDALRDSPVAVLASEEGEAVEILDPQGALFLAIDPIDGSGNIDLNMPVGTIFSVLPAAGLPVVYEAAETFHWPAGTSQSCAGLVVYGPQTMLVLATTGGVDAFTLDRRLGCFVLSAAGLRVPADTPGEYAINASNYRHWEEPIRSFVDDCLAGCDGPMGRDFNMRWHGAAVAEAYRILLRGGIYLYPSDARPGYRDGRLRLIYEAFPIAFIMGQAGGAASTGRQRILDLKPRRLHQHVPLMFGSRNDIGRIERHHHRPEIWPRSSAPLFTSRGLFRI